MPRLYRELGLVILEVAEDSVALTADAYALYRNVIGNAGNDTITGNAFDNVLNGEIGDDSLSGGAGNDVYVVDSAADVVFEADNAAGSGSADQIQSTVSFVLPNFVEILTLTSDDDGLTATGNALDNIIAGAAGENTLIGGEGNDSLFGAGDVDRLEGGSGNDTLDGGDGVDILIGGTGNDVYVVTSQTETVTEAAGEGNDTVSSTVSYTIATNANIENITLTGTAAIDATGNAEHNVLTGNGAANTLSGDGGNDTLDGGAGADRMIGGSGNDTYYVDNAGDLITDTGGLETVISSLTSYTLGSGLENARAADGVQSYALTGNELANVLTGNQGANILNGAGGADTAAGGAGDDTYIVDNVFDVVTEAVGAGRDTVTTSVRYALSPTAEVEFLNAAAGRANIRLTGSQYSNTITGNDGANIITALGGDDVLNGGRGRDYLSGGAGRDTFVFDSRLARNEVDRVQDFNSRYDSIHLDNAIFTRIGSGSEARPSALKSAFFRIGTEAKDSNDFIVYNNKTGVLYYDADGSGSRAAVQIATFTNKAKLTVLDFFVI